MGLSPQNADDWCAWAWAQHRDGRMDRAETGFRRALALDPASFPARFGLASLLLDKGALEDAAAAAARMAAEAADRPDVLWLQARLAHARGDAGGARNALERLLRYPGLNPARQAEAWLLLGLALGDGEEAFAMARRGKRIQRRLYAAQAADREGEVAKLRRLGTWLETSSADWASPQKALSGAAETHVFLLGFPRSGTTLLEQVLAAHPRVATLEEAPTLAAAYQAFLSGPKACAALAALDPEEAEAWADHYWHGVRERGIDIAGRTFVDKQPAGTLTLPVIARLFPRAKILFALRDPRDVVLSCFRQAFQMNAMTYAFTDLAETAACYDACMRLAEVARGRLQLPWADIRHEALVEDFDAGIARILDFLGLDPCPAMADFAQGAGARTIRTPSAPQVRAGLNRRGLGRWRQYREELAPVLPILAPWVERFGYAG
ncbi:MAG TPA: sulfotransferase [Allosphingosinicella sp.]|nr:sulfotransferase [Allosphingosinicella sp.]